MLKEGDLIMHETAGVCRVTGETTLDGLTGVYYILCPLYMKDATFYTPRDNGKVKIRPIMTREDALTLIDALPTVDSIKFQNFNDQKQRSTRSDFTQGSFFNKNAAAEGQRANQHQIQ